MSKKIFFEKLNNKKQKKNKEDVIFRLRQFSIFFVEVSGIGPWVNRMN